MPSAAARAESCTLRFEFCVTCQWQRHSTCTPAATSNNRSSAGGSAMRGFNAQPARVCACRLRRRRWGMNGCGKP